MRVEFSKLDKNNTLRLVNKDGFAPMDHLPALCLAGCDIKIPFLGSD